MVEIFKFNKKISKKNNNFNKIELLNFENKKKLLKLLYECNFTKKLRKPPFFNKKKNVSRLLIKNNCIFTKKNSSILNTFKISRICLRKAILNGSLYGLTKSS